MILFVQMALLNRSVRQTACTYAVAKRRFVSFAASDAEPRARDDSSDSDPSLRKWNHPFKTVAAWKTKKELVDELRAQILYKDECIAVINKPYGLLNYGYAKTRKDRVLRPSLYAGWCSQFHKLCFFDEFAL
jgi:23S rRNA-/tRNA-specific pseudouridylate synthase